MSQGDTVSYRRKPERRVSYTTLRLEMLLPLPYVSAEELRMDIIVLELVLWERYGVKDPWVRAGRKHLVGTTHSLYWKQMVEPFRVFSPVMDCASDNPYQAANNYIKGLALCTRAIVPDKERLKDIVLRKKPIRIVA
ncbi:MAG TPA: hypothetical protein VN081_06500 [Dongiaceae bacterium]|nr:hypothetical protein [Dongiaceae bacterium]